MRSMALRVSLLGIWMGVASFGFAAEGVAPGGITTEMSVTEAGAKAATMDSKEIEKVLVFLRSELKSASGEEKVNIEALIKKMERRKRSREGEEKAQAAAKKRLKLAEAVGAMDEGAAVPGPNADPTPTPQGTAVDEDAWMYRVTQDTFKPTRAMAAARTMRTDKLKKYIGILEEKKEAAKVSDPMNVGSYERVLRVYREQLSYRKK